MQKTNSEALDRLQELIKDIKVSMMTTVSDHGVLHSRPMWTQSFEGATLWFFLKDTSGKAHELHNDPRVNLSYIDSKTWVSVSGHGSIVHDRAKIDDLWTESVVAWFPKGKEEPGIALLRVDMETAEYWDVTSNSMLLLYGYLKAKMTGEAHKGELSDHQVVSV